MFKLTSKKMFSSPRLWSPRILRRKSKFRAKIVGVVVVTAITLGLATQSLVSSSKTISDVTITEGVDGFQPQNVTIRVGQSVRFVLVNGSDFWPASDLHPSHSLYPEFDAKRPVKAGDSYVFSFNKTGQWTYHDHLHPNFTGRIEVVGTMSASAVPCAGVDNSQPNSDPSQKYRCWDKQIGQKVADQGVGSGLNLMAELYDSSSDFRPVCHDFAHKIGKEAYKLFAKNKLSGLDQKVTYCGYGFYHGFMDELIGLGNDLSQAREFCNLIKSGVPTSSSSDTDVHCFHGIGHGVAEKHTLTSSTTKQEMIDPALRTCEQVADSDGRLTSCADGVYSSVMIAFQTKDRSSEGPNLISICATQPEKYQEGCYRGAGSVQLDAYHKNFAKASALVASIPEEKFAFEYVTQIAANRGRSEVTLTRHEDSIRDCQSLEYKYQHFCLSGLILSLMYFGAPEKQSKAGLDFCQTSEMAEEFRSSCFNQVLKISKSIYTKEKMKEVCSKVDSKYQGAECPIN